MRRAETVKYGIAVHQQIWDNDATRTGVCCTRRIDSSFRILLEARHVMATKNSLLFQLCRKCQIIKPFSDFYPSKRLATGIRTWCRECDLLYLKQRPKRNDRIPQHITYADDWSCPKCGSANKKHRSKGLCQKCYWLHFVHVGHWRERSRSHERTLKWETIRKLGGKCACCGIDTPEFLTVDHVKGDGSDHRRCTPQNPRGRHTTPKIYRDIKREGYPKDRYRVLCINCNFSIGIWGYCPHSVSWEELLELRESREFAPDFMFRVNKNQKRKKRT